MDDIRGGKANFLEPLPNDQYFFDPLECTQLVDEIHKLFQFIDQDSKGYVTVEEILEFQHNLAKKEEIKLTKGDENQIISSFFMQIDNRKNQNQGGLGIQHQHTLLIDWSAFRNTLNEWITQMSHISITIQDQNGNITQKDKLSLHQIISAFFVHTIKDKRIELLQRAHLQIENLERDLEVLNVYGNSSFSTGTIQSQLEVLQASKFLVNTFSSVLTDLISGQINQVESAFQRLKGMLEILTSFTQRFEILEISDHIRRVFDLILSSTILEIGAQILDQQDDMKISPIKIEVLRCIGLLSIAGKLFTQSEYQLQTEDQDGDMQFLQKLQAQLVNYDIVVKVLNQINSNCIEVRDQSILVIGHLIRNGLDLSQLIFESDYLGCMLQQIYPAQTQTSLRFISWCLYIICKRYYDPLLLLNQKQISYIQPLLQKLYEILVREDTPSEELLICTILSMGRILHIHPSGELVNSTFDIISQVLQQSSINANILVCQAALRAIYNTVKFTRLHTSTLCQLKLASHLQTLIDKNYDEKITLYSLQIIKEMILSDSQYYGIASDIIKALIEITNQNALHLVNFGFLRIICNNLQDFKLYKDFAIQQCYEINIQETGGGFAFGISKQNSPGRRTASNFRLYSYGYLFKNLLLLEQFLNFMQKRQQILGSFTQELLDKFRPLVDILHSQLSLLRTNDPIKISTTEYVLKFFNNLRNRIYQIGYEIDDSQIKYSEFIIQFLQQTLMPFEVEFPNYGSSSFQHMMNSKVNSELGPSYMMLVKCFDSDQYAQDNKIFEAPANIRYKDLQELMNKKYNNLPIQMKYIDEYTEQITIDSDLVLNKAIQFATKTAFKEQSKEIILRVLIHKLSSMYFQCFECGGQYARDPRIEINAASGGSNICTNCWPKYSQSN
ncbi:UNKNOWN [Stylonychia lemnae]|uniref:EF-hand domain-containing protein n=1 Tax=Stylonychia lemnae TaxID=5949 RepID=A0A078B4N9_STYLE|nr:UNKNOWN [Stylonychia lemnae]|eukprot:CDW88478.1 UNKNOWN [Stylonychia lemnae]